MNEPIRVQREEFLCDTAKWIAMSGPFQVVLVMKGGEVCMALGGFGEHEDDEGADG